MRRAIWLGALAVLGAAHSSLIAQSIKWKPVERPDDPRPTIRAYSGNAEAVILEAPLARDSSSAASGTSLPRPFPDAYRQGRNLNQPAVVQRIDPIPVIPPPGTVIAVGGSVRQPLPMPVGSIDPDDSFRVGEQFAVDRSGYSTREEVRLITATKNESGGVVQAEEKVPVGNWQQTYSATPPAPGTYPPVPEMESGGQPASRFYARAEYLLWWTKNDHTPPLITTGSETNLPLPRVDGAIGNADTRVLFGGELQRNPFSGARFTIGYAVDDCGDKYLEATGFFLGRRTETFDATSAQFPLLARPFFAANAGVMQEFVETVTKTGFAVGSVSVRAPSELWGIEPLMGCKWLDGCNYRIDVLAGARFLNLRESLTISEDLLQLAGGPLPGVRSQVNDRFATTNQFYGGEVGARGNWRYDRFFVEGDAKIGMGVTAGHVSIFGSQTFPPGTPGIDPRPGGLLALASNIGEFNKNRFAVVPEVGLRLGYDVNDSVRFSVGYNFIYWSSVMRPGDQIDRNIDVTQIPNFLVPPNIPAVNPPRPAVLLKETDYWAQGLTFGIEFRY